MNRTQALLKILEIYIETNKPVTQQFWQGLCFKAKEEIDRLTAENKRLATRDCNATIDLVYDDGFNPFAREELKVVDIGVSDNCYVVESEVVKAQAERIEKLEKALMRLGEYTTQRLNQDELIRLIQKAVQQALKGEAGTGE